MSKENKTENANAAMAAEDVRLDDALAAIRKDIPDDTESVTRVRARLQREAGWSEMSQAVVLPIESESELRTCEDFSELLPAYYAGELSEGRALLVEDHVRHCIPCRRAAQALRTGAAEAPAGRAANGNSGLRSFAAAAAVMLTLFASFLAWRQFWPTGQSELLQVKSIDGQLFALNDGELAPLFPGDWIDGGQEIRTAKGSGALLELADGSRIEVNERAALEVLRKRSGYRVRVDRGDIIVEAAKQREGTLDVTTDEMLVSVKGTIFAVSHGTKGSRVSVIEGEVQVEQARLRTSLYPGDQLGSRVTLTAHPLAQEIGWSGDVNRYLSMLEEFGELRDSLNQVLASAQPRYSSELLEQVPVNTAVYIALPNPTATLTEIYGLIRERVAANPALAGQWAQMGQGGADHVDRFIDAVRELSEFLGEETVVALGFDPINSGEPTPMVLSQVDNASGLHAALAEKIAELQAELDEQGAGEIDIVLLDESTTTVSASGEALYVMVANDMLVATTEISEINRIASGTSSGFAGSDFHGTVTDAYDRGAEYLGAVDLSALLGSQFSDSDDMALEFTGLGSIQYLVVERNQDEERAYTAADLTFSGERQGVAAWLANPGAMESLEFVSANATFASGAVHKDPVLILDEVLAMALANGEVNGLDEVEAELGFSLRDDLAAALGGEVTVAVDGPLLPTPSWKLILEVYDERLLQATLETLVQRINEEVEEGGVTLVESEGNGGRVFYSVEIDRPTVEGFDLSPNFTYTYVDGFMVAGPSRALVEQAIMVREGGASLVTSEEFQELLPSDGYVDFSAVVFNRLGETLASLADKLPIPDGVTEEQRQRIDGFLDDMADDGPGLYCFYGEDDRIRMVSNSPAFLPLGGLSSLVGLGGLPGVMSGIPGI